MKTGNSIIDGDTGLTPQSPNYVPNPYDEFQCNTCGCWYTREELIKEGDGYVCPNCYEDVTGE